MPRIRTFKPEFFRSPDTAKASHRARLLFLAMWSWADDHGRGETNLNGLLGFAFPDSDGITVAEMPCICAEVQCSWSVEFYSHRGRHFYAVPTWDQHQKNERRAASKVPAPDDPESSPDLRFRCDHGNAAHMHGNAAQSRGSSVPGTGEQGNRGTGEVTTLPTAAAASASAVVDPWLFSEFWKHYPRKVGKEDARKAWNLAIRKGNPDDIVAGADRYAKDPNLPSENFIPYPAKWLRGGHWSDGPLPPRTDGRPTRPSTDHILQGVAERVARSRNPRPEIEA